MAGVENDNFSCEILVGALSHFALLFTIDCISRRYKPKCEVRKCGVFSIGLGIVAFMIFAVAILLYIAILKMLLQQAVDGIL